MRSVFLSIVALVVLSVSATGFSASIESAGAVASFADADGAKMAKQVIEELGGKPQAWMLFGYEKNDESDFIENILAGVSSAGEDIPLAGCWTKSGYFAFQDGQALTGDVMLVGLRGEGIEFKSGLGRFSGPGNLVEAGRNLAQQVKPKSGKGLMIFITDSIPAHNNSYPVPEMFEAIQDVLGPQVGLIGGNAAYLGKPVFCDGEAVNKGLVGLMISGNIEFKIIQEPGKVAISPPLEITKLATPRQIVELEGEPWMNVYRKYIKDYMDPNKFDQAIEKKGGAFGNISRRFPHAIVREHGQLYVRLAHGLWPWGKGTNLPSECYNLKVGDKLVVTKMAEDQIGCVQQGLQRLKSNMPRGQELFLLFPCESNSMILRGQNKQKFFSMVLSEMPEDATAFGFMPCGEHASVYEPDKDEAVCEGRYHQLSYPMAVVVAR